MDTVSNYNGSLVIIDDWSPSYAQPVELRHYWPVGVDAKTFSYLIGRHVRDLGNGCFTVVDGQNAGVAIHLEDQGKTKPVYTEERPIPRPKGVKGHKMVYRYGKWQL